MAGLWAVLWAMSGGGLGACSEQAAVPPAERYEAAPVVWRFAPATEREAPKRVAQHLLTMEALSGPLIEVAMREDGRMLCMRWGEEMSAFLRLAEPDFATAAKIKGLAETDRAAIEDAYTRFGSVAARCMSGGDQARGTLMRVKDLVKPMLRAM
jgi:hypothetical protein